MKIKTVIALLAIVISIEAQENTTVQAVCIYRKLKLSIEKVKELEFEAYAYLHGKFDYIYILFLK